MYDTLYSKREFSGKKKENDGIKLLCPSSKFQSYMQWQLPTQRFWGFFLTKKVNKIVNYKIYL